MSHFSKVQTRIHDISILKKTLVSLGFEYTTNQKDIKDANGNLHDVNLVAFSSNNGVNQVLGFCWDGIQYNAITDVQFWNNDSIFDCFLEKLNQQYAMNVILNQTVSDGFQKVDQKLLQDGSIKVVVQRWS
uniref:Uncharacterized protein ycf35 n=1 Tax=Pterothamnion crispum TaxID=1550583 RepID=A0A4D6WX39_9FLOR|nr:hypothetical protein [Pterothamnion crispum]